MIVCGYIEELRDGGIRLEECVDGLVDLSADAVVELRHLLVEAVARRGEELRLARHLLCQEDQLLRQLLALLRHELRVSDARVQLCTKPGQCVRNHVVQFFHGVIAVELLENPEQPIHVRAL